MKNHNRALAAASVLCVLVGAASSVSAAAPALNVLFYGNSFTQAAGGIELVMQKVAVAAGQTSPSVVSAAVGGQTLEYHIASNTAVISSSAQSGKWDYVVLQEYSTRPIDATSAFNASPTRFLADAPTLYGLVKANSPAVKPVLYETWARQATNPDLHTWYPSQPVGTGSNLYMAAANQMQSELHKYYYQARANMGNVALAPVGDSFQALGFTTDLYQSDLYHESNKGGLMAAMLIYEQIYKDNVADIPYATIASQFGGTSAFNTNWGIADATAWNTFATLADTQTAAVPEPTSMVLLGAGAFALLTRRRRAVA